jgi:carbonic anhydrase
MGQGHDQSNPYSPYDFEAANKHYATEVHVPDPIVGARSRVGIITCCDARCIPERFFNLAENEAFVIRNGGGRTASQDVIRTILLVSVLSEIKELKVVHHTGKCKSYNYVMSSAAKLTFLTDCGSLAFSDEWIREIVTKNDPSMPGGGFKPDALPWAEALASQPFHMRPGDTERERVERSVRQDVQYLLSHPLVKPAILITGWVYDLHTGLVEKCE